MLTRKQEPPPKVRFAVSAHPSSDLRFAPATFSLKGRREEERKRLPKEPPSPLEGEGTGVRGALRW